jgi:UDP-N-acetylmuramate--alanine ligase
MFGKTEHVHFIGIGGIGMSGLAIFLHNMKFKVTGSDLQRSDITRTLQTRGVQVSYRHNKKNVRGADVVVFSTAVPKDNVELAEAHRCGITTIHRGELLAELTRMKIAVCISGTHGKTTTTSLIGEVLQHGKFSPTTLVGGIVRGKSQATIGKGEYLVCEADESDRSFLRLYPSYAVITNIEAEHLDHYANLDEIKENFVHFANHVPFWGCTFLGTDTKGALDIQSRISRRTITYGVNEHAQLRAVKIRKGNLACSFDVIYGNDRIGQFTSRLLGTHNITNMVAAIGVGLELGIPVATLKKALRSFKGVHRRIEYHGSVRGVLIFDDYGHHPTEIAVTLQTIREYYPNRRIISVFQPHRYTRTYHLFNDFAYSFFGADVVIITKIYAAHEIPIPGITGESLAKRVRKEQEAVYYVPEFDAIIAALRAQVKKGDIVVVQGAGDINRLASCLLKELA